MIGNYQRVINSSQTLHFTEALLQDEISANYDIQMPSNVKTVFLSAITIVSLQALAYELWLFESATNLTSNPSTDRFIGGWQFGAPFAGGFGYPVTVQATGVANTLSRYTVNADLLPYTDYDALQAAVPSLLHVRLVNRSATPKAAGVLGALQVSFYCANQGVQA